MIILSEDKKNELRSTKVKVYSLSQLSEGTECFNSNKSLSSKRLYITFVDLCHIKYEDNKFYYTTEDLSDSVDWWPTHLLNVSKNFKKIKKTDLKCTSKVSNSVGKKIDGHGCLVDVSNFSEFNGMNEDTLVFEYRFYLTLFNEYTIKQLRYERHDLFDAKFESSKFDLPAKMQNADFLKQKDFKMINYKRKDSEAISIGVVLKEGVDKYSLEYGLVFIDMNNVISVKWH